MDSKAISLDTLNKVYAIAHVDGVDKVCVKVNAGLYSHGSGTPKCVLRNYLKHLQKWRHFREAMYHEVPEDAPLKVGESVYILDKDHNSGEFYFVVDIAHKKDEKITYIVGK